MPPDALQEEEQMKKRVGAKLEMARFLQVGLRPAMALPPAQMMPLPAHSKHTSFLGTALC